MGTFDLHAVASEVFHVLRETTDRRIAKEVRIPAGACSVHGSESDIYHALMNLGVNAVHAMQELGGGRLTVRARREPAGLVVEFQDTGPGLDEATSAHVFEPFFTTKANGTGLGLSVSYGIVRDHGGKIDVTSEPGKGSAFRVTLSLVQRKGE